MAMPNQQQHTVVPVFKIQSIKNEGKSKEAGRPIYDDIEVCEVRFSGDRQRVGVFPAHAFAGYIVNEEGYEVEQTYAMRFNDQYLRFKQGHAQIASGTPIDELPFLPQAKRLELKALNIYTAEALAALDSNQLKTLGMNGRQLKDQAEAYLKAANGTAEVTKLAADNVALQHQLDEMRREMSDLRQTVKAQPAAPTDAFDAMADEDLKAFIKEKAGQAPRGNPSHATLVAMAREVSEPAAA